MSKASERKEKNEEKIDERRQVVPTPEDPELFEWLEAQFSLRDPRAQQPGQPGPPDAMPERIKVCSVRGVDGRDHGPPVLSKEWKPMASPAPTREELVILTNVILAKARREATIIGKPMRFGAHVYSSLKGVEAYERFLFVAHPGAKEYSEHDAHAADDEIGGGNTLMKHLEMSLQHQRWMAEQFSDAIGGVLARQDATIERLTRSLAESAKDAREMIRLREEVADRSVERQAKLQRLALQEKMVNAGFDLLQNLVPVVAMHLTKGKAGGDIGVRKFVETLSDDQARRLFGRFHGDSSAILSLEQCELLSAIAKGQLPPSRLRDFIDSIDSEQMAKIGELLTQEQIGVLMAINQALTQTHGPAASANGVAS